MSSRLRKIVALTLVAWLLVLSNSYAVTLGSETQHELEWTHSDASGKAPEACGHGCVGHLSAHVVGLEQSFQFPTSERRRGSLVSHPNARALRWQAEPFSPPPNPLS